MAEKLNAVKKVLGIKMIDIVEIQRLMYVTSLIELEDGDTATGFFYQFVLEDNVQVPLLITNWHVVDNTTSIHAIINQVSLNDRKPLIGKYYDLNIDCLNDDTVYKHPNKNIDLAAVELRPYLQKVPKNTYFMNFLNENEKITANDLHRMHVMQDVVMVGYPNGIFDQTNKLPIFRKGVVATEPSVDYDGEKCFLIDAACFPGSSGSPIFSYENNTLGLDEHGYIACFSGLSLMGILSAGYQSSINGVTDESKKVESDMPNNLGIVIKASCLDAFKSFFIYKNR